MRLLRILTARNILSPVLLRDKLSNQAIKSCSASYSSTVDQSDVDLHSKLSSVWWNTGGHLRGLHSMNQIRVPFIVEELTGIHPDKDSKINRASLLDGFKIMDIGCGGGILSEPLARIGAQVTGIDASANLIQVAKNRASIDRTIINNVNYVNTTIEEFVPDNEGVFDAVVASEVLEHVENPKLFVEYCARALKPGGSLFITTIDRTTTSWITFILIAETIVGVVPKGTHDWNKFIKRDEARQIIEACGCYIKVCQGMWYNSFTNLWKWEDLSLGHYAIHAMKPLRSEL